MLVGVLEEEEDSARRKDAWQDDSARWNSEVASMPYWLTLLSL